MGVENIRYNILSRGKDKPEKFAEKGEIVNLKVQKKRRDTVWDRQQPDYKEDTSKIPIETAKIIAEFADRLGYYSHITGKAQIDQQEEMQCEASYATGLSYPEKKLIGELILKRKIKKD